MRTHAFRCADEYWEHIEHIAKTTGCLPSDVIREAVEFYIAEGLRGGVEFRSIVLQLSGEAS